VRGYNLQAVAAILCPYCSFYKDSTSKAIVKPVGFKIRCAKLFTNFHEQVGNAFLIHLKITNLPQRLPIQSKKP
jgi:hypothetical protein